MMHSTVIEIWKYVVTLTQSVFYTAHDKISRKYHI